MAAANASRAESTELAGRVVVVLGGAGGIGSEVVAACAAKGAAVAIVGRTAGPALEASVGGIHALGGAAAAYTIDVRDRTALERLAVQVRGDLGPVYGLVNCAAIMANGPFLETSDDTWAQLIATNLLAVVSACRAVLPDMIEAGRGSIVNVSSRLAETGAADAAVYASVKAAAVALTRSLAAEFGPAGVRANVVAPGTVATKMGRSVIDSIEGQRRRRLIPLQRFVTPAEVADAMVFLLTDAAGGVTGQTIRVNAGEFMG